MSGALGVPWGFLSEWDLELSLLFWPHLDGVLCGFSRGCEDSGLVPLHFPIGEGLCVLIVVVVLSPQVPVERAAWARRAAIRVKNFIRLENL